MRIEVSRSSRDPSAIGAILAIVLVALLCKSSSAQDRGVGLIDDRPRPARAEPRPEIDLQERLSKLLISEGPLGYEVTIEAPEGPRTLSADEYIEAVRRSQLEQQGRGIFYVIFNISSPAGLAWVALGFLGQALFTFRMLLQWLASEKQKRSVVPVGFWWGSLAGGLMLLVYFVWRKDIVGIVGQSTGAFVYARNLVLIHRQGRAVADLVPTSERI